MSEPYEATAKASVGDIGHLDYPEQGKYIVLQIVSNNEVLVEYEYTTYKTGYVGTGRTVEFPNSGLKQTTIETHHTGKQLWLSKINTVGLKIGEPEEFDQPFYISGTRITQNALKERESFLYAEAFKAPDLAKQPEK
jgi:hypothetical protein